jgi:hypothetical protein
MHFFENLGKLTNFSTEEYHVKEDVLIETVLLIQPLMEFLEIPNGLHPVWKQRCTPLLFMRDAYKRRLLDV